jgi:hypothetical protein
MYIQHPSAYTIEFPLIGVDLVDYRAAAARGRALGNAF